MGTYRVLSLDGGGIRGLLTAIVLRRLAESFPSLLDKVDLIAGTSTGGIIALGLAKGLAPETLQKLYQEKGRDIFDDSWFDDIKDMGKIFGADYSNSNLKKELRRIFRDDKLSDLGKRVLIPTFDLDNEDADPEKRSWKPKLFHNYEGPNSDGDQFVYKVALMTSAAPTYFPSYEGYVDGGVYANNPSLAALAQTQDKRYLEDPPELGELVLLSISTGKPLTYIKGKKKDWGYAQWAKPLISLMMDGVMGVADYQCRQILRERYHRVEPVFPSDNVIKLDDVGKISALVEFAEAVNLDDAIRWLQENWE